jgi:eukaryotic-like serine/threonine-protein kinase
MNPTEPDDPLIEQTPTRAMRPIGRTLTGENTPYDVILGEDAIHESEHVSGMSGNSSTIAETPSKQRTQIGQYQLVKQIGRGGMGVVYLAKQPKLERTVALKIIPKSASGESEDFLRFQAEAQMVGSLKHPNIVQVYEAGEDGNYAFLAMEFVEGGTLHQLISTRRMEIMDCIRLIIPLAEAIHFAHSHHIIHRDLKPSNILLAPKRGTYVAEKPGTLQAKPMAEHTTVDVNQMIPKITDFGLAKSLNQRRKQLTVSGVALGTPSYMSPEQARGESAIIGPLSDVYALGVMLYEMLTGRPPFIAATAMSTMEQVCYTRAIPPSQLRHDIPYEFEVIILQCLEKQPHRRFQSAQLLADRLKELLATYEKEGVRTHPVRDWMRRKQVPLMWISAMCGAVLLGFLLIWLIPRLGSQGDRVGVDAEVERLQRELDEARLRELELSCDLATLYGELGDTTRCLGQLNQSMILANRYNRPTMERSIRLNNRLWSRGFIPTEGKDADVIEELHPDGNIVAIGSMNGNIRLLDQATNQLRAGDFNRHQGKITALAFSKDGRFLISASANKTLRIWDVETSLQLGPPHKTMGVITQIQFDANATTVIAADDNGEVEKFPLPREKR